MSHPGRSVVHPWPSPSASAREGQGLPTQYYYLEGDCSDQPLTVICLAAVKDDAMPACGKSWGSGKLGLKMREVRGGAMRGWKKEGRNQKMIHILNREEWIEEE